MRKLAALFSLLACVSCAATPPVASPKPTRVAARPITLLSFDEMLATGAQFAPRVLAANGTRVRLRGFIAEMEIQPVDGFFLTRRPVTCDEAGGGTADLPPDAVFVQAASSQPIAVPASRGPVEVVGVLDVGYRAHADGFVSQIRILLPRTDIKNQPTSKPSGG